VASFTVPLVLVLAPSGGPVSPPESSTAQKIAQDLRSQLLNLGTTFFTSHGYTFLVQADPRGGAMPSPHGLRACFVPPSSTAGPVSARQLTERVDDKTRKYRHLAATFDVPLVVAVGGHRFTGMHLEHVDHLLGAAQTFSFQFSFGDTFIGEKEINLGRPEQWTMPVDLSGLLWVDNEMPFSLSARSNPHARMPMPACLAKLGA